MSVPYERYEDEIEVPEDEHDENSSQSEDERTGEPQPGTSQEQMSPRQRRKQRFDNSQ